MPSKAEKLLEQMKNSKSNWKRADLDTLYEGFGFVIKHGSNHDIYKHPKFPELWGNASSSPPACQGLCRIYGKIS